MSLRDEKDERGREPSGVYRNKKAGMGYLAGVKIMLTRLQSERWSRQDVPFFRRDQNSRREGREENKMWSSSCGTCVERCNPDVSISRHRISRAENSEIRNPKSSSPEGKILRHARRITSKGIVRRVDGSARKLPYEMLTSQRTSRKNIPDRCARSNNSRSKMPSTKKDSKKKKPSYCTYEVGECSGIKDDSRRVIEEEEAEAEEAEDFEMESEHEMLRKMKRKPKSKEKCYRYKMCSEHQTERVLGKKDAKVKLQAALTAAEKKKKPKL